MSGLRIACGAPTRSHRAAMSDTNGTNGNGVHLRAGKWLSGAPLNQFNRRDVRRLLVQEVGEAIPKLRGWIEGRAKVLIGFSDAAELAERWHESYERHLNPDADRVMPWAELPEERRSAMIDAFSDVTGGGLGIKQVMAQVSVSNQQAALDLAMRYGLGTQLAPVDDEGNTLPGVIYLPPPEIHATVEAQVRAQQKALASGDEIGVEYEFIVEDISDVDRMVGEQQPPPIEERINPALVEYILHKHKPKNGAK